MPRQGHQGGFSSIAGVRLEYANLHLYGPPDIRKALCCQTLSNVLCFSPQGGYRHLRIRLSNHVLKLLKIGKRRLLFKQGWDRKAPARLQGLATCEATRFAVKVLAKGERNLALLLARVVG